MKANIIEQKINNSVDLSVVQQPIRESGHAFREYSKLPQSGREEVVSAIRKALQPLISEIAELEINETGMGDVKDKVVKLMLALQKTPGVEDIASQVHMGDDAITLYEYSAYGVICAIQPEADPCATIINNTIGMLAAGNSVIVIPHPGCASASQFTVNWINKAIYSACAIENLVICISKPSMQQVCEIMGHPDVALVVATGGGKTIRQALATSKRVIGAGAANPVAMVDETADLNQAAKNIIDGASFDHNTTCVSEKNIVVVSSVKDLFVDELVKQGVFYISDPTDMLKLTKTTINSNFFMNRSFAGKSANQILKAAEISCEREVRLIVVETVKTHPFVTVEMLMPIVPLVSVLNFDDLLETALFIEQGYRHTAILHSQSISRLNRAAQIMQTSVFVKNGSSLSALGFDGGVGMGFTIANITGEGVTTARNFARRRRCSFTMGDV